MKVMLATVVLMCMVSFPKQVLASDQPYGKGETTSKPTSINDRPRTRGK